MRIMIICTLLDYSIDPIDLDPQFYFAVFKNFLSDSKILETIFISLLMFLLILLTLKYFQYLMQLIRLNLTYETEIGC